MYGKSKNDLYKTSKWPNHEKSSRRNDIDLNSESDYEDKTEQSYDKPTSYNDYFTKLTSTINDIKTDIKNPNQDKMNEKMDTLLEYVKSIDSDTKNAFEILGRIDKSTAQYLITDTNVNCTCDFKELIHLLPDQIVNQLKNLSVCQPQAMPVKDGSSMPVKDGSSMPVKDGSSIPVKDGLSMLDMDEENLIVLIKECYRLNLLNNKSRLKMDILPLKFEAMSNDMEMLHHDIHSLVNTQHNTNRLLNKLIMDNDHLKKANLLLHKKLDSISFKQPNINEEFFKSEIQNIEDHIEDKKFNDDVIDHPVENIEDKIENNIEDNIEDKIENNIEDNIEDKIENNIEDKIEDKIENNIEDKIEDEIEDKIEDENTNDKDHDVEYESVSLPTETVSPMDEMEEIDNESKSESEIINNKYYKITNKPKMIRSVPIKQKNKTKK